MYPICAIVPGGTDLVFSINTNSSSFILSSKTPNFVGNFVSGISASQCRRQYFLIRLAGKNVVLKTPNLLVSEQVNIQRPYAVGSVTVEDPIFLQCSVRKCPIILSQSKNLLSTPAWSIPGLAGLSVGAPHSKLIGSFP